MKPWTEARNNKYMKYHSKLTYQKKEVISHNPLSGAAFQQTRNTHLIITCPHNSSTRTMIT